MRLHQEQPPTDYAGFADYWCGLVRHGRLFDVLHLKREMRCKCLISVDYRPGGLYFPHDLPHRMLGLQ